MEKESAGPFLETAIQTKQVGRRPSTCLQTQNCAAGALLTLEPGQAAAGEGSALDSPPQAEGRGNDSLLKAQSSLAQNTCSRVRAGKTAGLVVV